MKYLFSLLISSVVLSTSAQEHKLTKLWETDSLAVPESVLPVLKENFLFTSLIDGGSSIADGKGGIAKVGLDGKILNSVWIIGLNAPKGLGLYDNKLYVADLTEVVVIDVKAGKISTRIPIQSTLFLNDITIDKKGTVYVSDTRLGKIFRIINNKPELWIDNTPNVNGLKAIGNELYILSGPKLIKADKNKNITTIAEGFAKGGDGLEQLSNGDFIVSCWNGLIYYVYKNGKIELLLDTQEQKINTADFGLDTARNIIYVPTFNKKSIIAFTLN